MAIIKCKMCGGELILIDGASTAECEFCGSVQTIPNLDDEKKLIQFERAERLRKQCEFDKAASIYETIVADFRQEAEAYWGLVLCKYGIEYVDDPVTGKKIPTCHRSSFESIMEDSDFEQALENADGKARRVYREEAKAIEEIRKGIIAVSANEEPYDIFICYKETDESGDRTIDSVLAQDVYDALTDKGYCVFFSRITLEGKLGVEYEPYIFAALNSAKIMLVFGTDYEYFNAVWVKNEWSRFLKLMAKDKSKHLIPCFKGIDAYDMPREFARLQAQDLSKVGANQDLLRGIEKLLPRKIESTGDSGMSAQTINSGVAPLLERAYMFLEDSEWDNATTYCERVLDLEPKNAMAYLGKFLAELRLTQVSALKTYTEAYIENVHYKRVRKYASAELNAELDEYLRVVHEKKMDEEYGKALELYQSANDEMSYEVAAVALEKLIPWKNSEVLSREYRSKLKELQNDKTYQAAKELLNSEEVDDLEKARNMLLSIADWRDAKSLLTRCNDTIRNFNTQKVYLSAKRKMKTKNVDSIQSAIDDFTSIISWADSKALIDQCHNLLEECEKEAKYQIAIKEANTKGIVSVLAPMEAYAFAAKALQKVVADLSSLNGWRDSEQKIKEYERRIVELTEMSENFETIKTYRSAKAKMESKHPESIKTAIEEFESIIEWKDSEKLLQRCYTVLDEIEKGPTYSAAITIANSKGVVSVLAPVEAYSSAQSALREAIEMLKTLNGWRDSEHKIKEYESRIAELQQKELALQEIRRQQDEKKLERQKTWRSTGKCQHCGGNLKGFFTKKCVECGREKDY